MILYGKRKYSVHYQNPSVVENYHLKSLQPVRLLLIGIAMVQTTRILAKNDAVMILNDSFQQRTDFDSGRNINVCPIPIFQYHNNSLVIKYFNLGPRIS